jgi:hypothetical protein
MLTLSEDFLETARAWTTIINALIAIIPTIAIEKLSISFVQDR